MAAAKPPAWSGIARRCRWLGHANGRWHRAFRGRAGQPARRGCHFATTQRVSLNPSERSSAQSRGRQGPDANVLPEVTREAQPGRRPPGQGPAASSSRLCAIFSSPNRTTRKRGSAGANASSFPWMPATTPRAFIGGCPPSADTARWSGSAKPTIGMRSGNKLGGAPRCTPGAGGAAGK